MNAPTTASFLSGGSVGTGLLLRSSAPRAMDAWYILGDPWNSEMIVPMSKGPPKSFLARKLEKKCLTKRAELPSETLGQSVSIGSREASGRQSERVEDAEAFTNTILACG